MADSGPPVTGGSDAGEPMTERERNETPTERADRNLAELLGELRVALPGVQVLFAFLLVVPFSEGFTRVTEFQQSIYFVTLLCSAAASAMLIAPTAYHRINFRQRDKIHIVLVSNRLALGGLAALALAMTGVILLITDVLFAPLTTMIATAATGGTFVLLWFVGPIGRRLTRKRRAANRSDQPAG
jgi:hypothetical protein